MKSLCLVCECGSIKEAAKRLYLTSSAVSLQIKEFQAELGIKLFTRTSKKMVLTSQGEEVYQDAKKILDSVRDVTEKAKNLQDTLAGKITLAAPACLRSYYLPDLARFRRSYPAIRLSLLARSHENVPSLVRSEEADLALGLFEHHLSDLEEIPLVIPKLSLIVPHGHPFSSRRRIKLEELCSHSLVVLQPGTTTRKVIDAAFQAKRLNARLAMEASTCVEIKRYVQYHLGLGILHNICLSREDNSRFTSINIEGEIPHPPAKLIFRRDKRLTVSEKTLIDLLQHASKA